MVKEFSEQIENGKLAEKGKAYRKLDAIALEFFKNKDIEVEMAPKSHLSYTDN